MQDGDLEGPPAYWKKSKLGWEGKAKERQQDFFKKGFEKGGQSCKGGRA